MSLDLNSSSVEYLEALYTQFLDDPSQVAPEWREYFQRLSGASTALPGRVAAAPTPAAVASPGPSFRPPTLFRPQNGNGAATAAHGRMSAARAQEAVDLLIRNYRVRGHMIAKVDPLGMPRPPQPELDPSYYGLTEADLDQPFSTTQLQGANEQTLRGILQRLQDTYCGYISAQFMYIDEIPIREWLQQRMENVEHRIKLQRKEQLRILTRLTDAVMFEEFIRRKFVGAKSFSLEGAESLVPLLDLAIEKAGRQGVQQIVMGMAHRGRLNVLANIIGKSPQEIFREFADVDAQLYRGRGDVKYHLGYSNDWITSAGHTVHLSLCFNPSHLEFVNPVVLGLTRAKQDRGADFERETAMPILIHGDAAFIGEGVVQETLNLSQLTGYTVGGTLHIIVNNQIGFTTSPEESRSTVYATDIARMLQSPIFHVNGEHPEAVAQVIDLAMDFRKEFRRDVVVDMYCYRRWGHNEADEPSFTQPLLYDVIGKRMNVRDGYLEHLLALGEVTREEADEIAEKRREHLEHALSLARREDFVPKPKVLAEVWKGYHGGVERQEDDIPTALPKPRLAGYLQQLTDLPDGFNVHRKLERMMESRRKMATGEAPVDWAAAEILALGSLAVEGYRVRFTGQDVRRGTFSQRHAVLHDVKDGRRYMPVAHLLSDQAPIELYNSPLSEAGVLGFEYGFSLGYPDGLVLWEAQFGDFANAAQVIIDQFIASAESKWRNLSGLVLLLPHGLEGQGPEHSSARIERYLGLSAEDNWQVVVPSTPAQYFHLLRRQALRRWQKPLIVFTPKSLLRHPKVVSPLDDLATGEFQRFIPDPLPCEKPRRVLLCAGKVYYDLLAEREKRQMDDVPIIRIEQIYPLKRNRIPDIVGKYPEGTPVCWVQEEPKNMGAWSYWRLRFGDRLMERYPFSVISRPSSTSPASGSHGAYEMEQEEIVHKAFE